MSWTINYVSLIANQKFTVDAQEKKILRELANKVAELAAQPLQQQKVNRWKDHHALKETPPLIFCDPENAWYELIPAEKLHCSGNLARIWEFKLLKEIYWADRIHDDRAVLPIFSVHYIWSKTSRGLETKIIGGQNGGAYKWEAPLKNGYEKMDALKPALLWIDETRTQELEALAHEVFDDILDVRLEGVYWWSLGMTTDLIMLRGFDNILFDFYDHPDEVHRLMAFLRDENLAMLDFLEKNKLLTLNNGGDFHGTGGYAWTDELPAEDFCDHVRTKDMWGFCESQETVGVSPEMFAEFVFPYQRDVLKRFGLNIYGCCEPLDSRWNCVKHIPHLRKVTVSPWSNDEAMAECLSADYVFCKKVNPARIATSDIDEEAIRKELRTVFDAVRRNKCHAEVLMRDILTVACNANNLEQWVRIARTEAEK
ncbi:MAG: hypothetical protein JXN60_05495 [Lentisphaerae bacterium]|nr:hypothetical protein [Lentisphaerota bacterium]